MASPAQATPAPPTNPPSSSTPGTATSSNAAQGSGASPYAAGYESLAAAMIGYYAQSTGASLNGFLSANATTLAQMIGTPQLAGQLEDLARLQQLGAGQASAMGTLAAPDTTPIAKLLAQNAATVDTTKLTNLAALYTELTNKSGTLDAKVVLSGATWATELASGVLPKLSAQMPKLTPAGEIDPASIAKIPPEGLAFGMFMNRSLTQLVKNHPDVFAQVQQSGLGSQASIDAWKKSMMAGAAQGAGDFSGLGSPCLAEMLNVMSGAKATGTPGCAPCATAGIYLRENTASMFNPSMPNLPNAKDGQIAPSEWAQMDPWLQKQLQDQNPGLKERLGEVVKPAVGTQKCLTSSQATSGALKTTLPGVFANLSK